LLGAVAVMLPLFAFAEEPVVAEVQNITSVVVSVDAEFDKTGDGIVDASDWGVMTELERQAYARASLKVLGEDPDVILLQGKSRVEQYLEGLRSVYE